ncbi:putative disease resistance protein At4g10780 isoform X3 [Quercus robur]|uniref:putative disease resistance protein At4g10780 isoform X3 n=1 Tax=Quercus robur TaxID=38942 RepID=UPI002162549A|nr:putative disease resistance protein At4g10780 isoform X3 [Quercus robur]
MEMLGAILELGKTILAPISEYYKYHRSVDEHMKNLKRKRDDLECKKSDIESKMRAELLPRKKPKREVEFWLQKVNTINVEIQNTEQEAERAKYFSRMHVGKIACQKIQEVTELIDQSCGFGESLVIDPPVSYGDELPTGALVGESTAEITTEKIWKHLLDEDCGMIGVYGMGGVGKTTIMKKINNRLLKEKDKFNHVIWVTVSKAFDVIKLQNAIASMLHPNPLKSEDETTRAGKLYAALKEMKKCVLILDDLWNAFPLENIGIPEPTSENGCKLVLTTRDAKVCDGMNCKTIKVELLSIKESRDLFLKTVGCDVSNIPEDVVEGVVKQCARLPLAIITIAGSLKNVVDVFEWRNTLNELRTSTKGSAHVDAPVLKRLQFSYERLKDKKLQDCLLCCALYPEDYEIYRDELIEHLIGEKVIESMKSRQEELDQGHTLLNKLENACLLEGGSKDFIIEDIFEEKRRFVKMHDLIRDMALQIAGAKFLVLEDVPNEEEWGNDVEKVSLMCKRGSKFPYVSPKCPKLSTLLLRGYENIIPDPFFVHLHGLRVLHVDCDGLESLPNSVSDLKHLTSLRLNSYDLECVPSLAKLTALRSLDLSVRSLEEIPHGLEMLVNLRYLNVESYRMNHKMMPPGILPKLCQLQVLKLPIWGLDVNGEEMVRLKKLECFEGTFDGVKGFNTYVESLEEGGPSHYKYAVNQKKPASQLGVAELGESVILSDCNICLLPKDVRALIIWDFQRGSLCQGYWKKSVWLNGCEEIEYINSYFDTFSLQSLEILDLVKLNNLKGLFREEKVAPAPVVPLGTFSRLKQFSILHCPNIKKLFTPRLLLDNLEQIDVFSCKQLEEIIGGAEASDEVEEEEAKEIVKIFPQLRELRLKCLPELKTICSSSNVILCDSLNSIEIRECPKLKRLPLSLHLIDGELSSPPSSLQIYIAKESWESLEWDNHDMKMVLEPFIERDTSSSQS